MEQSNYLTSCEPKVSEVSLYVSFCCKALLSLLTQPNLIASDNSVLHKAIHLTQRRCRSHCSRQLTILPYYSWVEVILNTVVEVAKDQFRDLTCDLLPILKSCTNLLGCVLRKNTYQLTFHKDTHSFVLTGQYFQLNRLVLCSLLGKLCSVDRNLGGHLSISTLQGLPVLIYFYFTIFNLVLTILYDYSNAFFLRCSLGTGDLTFRRLCLVLLVLSLLLFSALLTLFSSTLSLLLGSGSFGLFRSWLTARVTCLSVELDGLLQGSFLHWVSFVGELSLELFVRAVPVLLDKLSFFFGSLGELFVEFCF